MTKNKTYKVLTASLGDACLPIEDALSQTAEDLEDALNHLEAESYEVDFIQFVEHQGFVVCGRQLERDVASGFNMGDFLGQLKNKVPGGKLHPGIHEAVQRWKRELSEGHDMNGTVRSEEDSLYDALDHAFRKMPGDVLSKALDTVTESMEAHECADEGDCQYIDDLKLIRRQLRKLINDRLQ